MAAEILNLKLTSCATVSYGDAFGSEDFKLLEVDECILKELLQDGLMIKGGPDDEAVLCTSVATYAIKYVSTSNTVLLIPPKESITNGNDDTDLTMAHAVATSSGHLELVETAPRLDNLKTLLNQRPYIEDLESGQMQEEEEQLEGLYSWDDLTTIMQASGGQLKEALKALSAVQIGAYWRVIDERFMQGLLEVMFLSAVQHDWDLKCLQQEAVVQALKDDCYSPQIVRHCLSCYGKQVRTLPNDCKASDVGFLLKEENGIEESRQLWELDETKVCLHYAKRLLHDSAKWKLEEFMKEWQRTTPAGMKPSIEMLRGEALVEKIGPESWLRLYSISSLPTKPADRLSALFKERAKWEWDDLEPYLRDMQAPGQSVEAMLLKYTRKTQLTASSTAIYTAR